ncbi:uncharacterized protein KY384_005911 [Bacidia gigantensis]|uniref:uncharacterized protein n=1 Tax=Bacidia gigantensis TaxID=2732470 RepID=UPI001D0426E2|nr:uncharacterized protein KY384_005911 [Bacidia gigantensis]KAG8529276.1 hypothetical protein KY384_005911 [Bacidia gigantensis]
MTANLSDAIISDGKVAPHTLTGLKRWSCQGKELPPVSQIKALHVYDFDNTLFKSPLPNPKLWQSQTVSRLQNQDVFVNGGWWHDKGVLGATGGGIDVEEPRAWASWWNEQINDALNVLLTGRGERNFSELIKRIVASKRLDFDLICLKSEAGPKNQRFGSTMQYKQAFLQDLIYTYAEAEELKIYEDRPKQYLKTEVIQVADQVTTLDPVVEIAEVQRMVNNHNTHLPSLSRPLELKRTVFYTGYLISATDTSKLLGLVKVPSNFAESEVKYLANSILIDPRPANAGMMNKVGGLGSKQTWQVTGFAFYQYNLWAVRVAPVPPESKVHTFGDTPTIVLATYKNTKAAAANSIQNWQPIPADKQYILQTEVGEKVQLRLEAESGEGGYDNVVDRRNLKRRHSPNQVSARNGPSNDENRRTNGSGLNGRTGNNNRHKGNAPGPSGGRPGTNSNNSRGGRVNGPSQGSARANRQRGPKTGGYKSLDDMAGHTGRYGPQRGEPTYDDYVPAGAGHNAPFLPGKNKAALDGTGGLPYGQ